MNIEHINSYFYFYNFLLTQSIVNSGACNTYQELLHRFQAYSTREKYML